jgi:hypothetical protein
MAREMETPETRRTRLNLIKFVDVTETALTSVHRQLQVRTADDFLILRSNLAVLFTEVGDHFTSLRKNLEKGLNRSVVESLKRVGLYWNALKAKLQILFDCIRNGSLSSVLTALNSILGSLAGVLGAAEFIKEFKEMLEVAIDRLGPETDPITLKLELPDLD